MTAPNRCGAQIYRCGECGTAVAPSRVRRGETCPRHEGAEVVDGYCEKRIAPGRLRCSKHGAGAPQVRSVEDERRLEADVEQLLADREIRPVTNPLEALQKLLGEVVAVKDAFADRVDELHQLTTVDQLGREDVRALLSAYERALDRAGKLLVDASRLNIDERLVEVNRRIGEEQGQVLSRVIKAITEHEAVPPELRDWLNRAIAKVLRAGAADLRGGFGFDDLNRGLSLVEAPGFKIVVVRPGEAIEVVVADVRREVAVLPPVDPEPLAEDEDEDTPLSEVPEPVEPPAGLEPPPAAEVEPPGRSLYADRNAGGEPRSGSEETAEGDPWAGKQVDPHTPGSLMDVAVRAWGRKP